MTPLINSIGIDQCRCQARIKSEAGDCLIAIIYNFNVASDQFQPRLELVGAGPKPRERQRGVLMIITIPLCLSLGLGPAPTNFSRGWN